MSVNQSRGDKNEPPHHRRPGRSGNPASPRNFSGGGGGGGGGKAGGSSSTAPPPSSAFHSGKSFKKVVSNAQGAQARVPGPNPNPNGANIQPPLRGTPDAIPTGATVKPADASVQKSSSGLPKAPQSNVVPPGSSTAGLSTPVKGPADASKAFSLQFGSISPNVINGMPVPARTNSAPPNMDEQKRAQLQAQHDPSKATSYQNPAVSKQHLPRKDPGPVDHPGEAHPISKEKKDMLFSPPGPVPAHAQKPSGPPMPSIPMQMPFHQSQIHIPFGGQNPPLQSQNIGANTVPLPMHLPVGNTSPQVPPQVFVPGIQHHQGIIHPSQGLTFSSQMAPQLGNMGGMGMGLGPQYQQQPMGNLNFGGTRRTVKITHPDTHEELRLDKRTDGYLNGGSSGQRSQLQSQAFPPTGHHMNYYPSSYNAGALFPQPPGSNPLTSSQAAPGSQPPRFYNQASKQVTVKQPATSSHAEKVTVSMDKSQKAGGEGQPHKDSETIAGSSLPQSVNLVNTSAVSAASAVEEQNQPGKKAQSIVTTEKIGGQSLSASMASVAHHGSNESGVQEASELSETSNKVEGPSHVPDASASECDESEGGLNSTSKVICSGNSSLTVDESVVGSKEQIKESVDQNQDGMVPDATLININVSVSPSDVDVLSAETSVNMVSSLDDKMDNQLSKFDVDQVSSRESVSVTVPETSPLTSEVDSTGSISPSSSSKVKGNTPSKGKKKIKEILKNADARGTTSDLYNAYKRPEEKKETSSSAEVVENPNASVDSISRKEDVLSRGPTKVEPDDWEDAADLSTPKMETGLKLKRHSKDDNDGMTKKYSRDFLLKFSEHCTDLPEGIQIADISEVLASVNVAREPYPSPGRGGGDRSVAGSRLDRRPSNVGVDDKWSKGAGGPMGPDMGYPTRGNHGVLRTPRGQPPGQYPGGILSGPMQSPGPQMQRNNSESDRWQRATGYQRGLMPSPHTPMMHKAERKYEVGKVTDEEQAKQRQLKGILNKLTPQNFEKLFEQVKQVNIDNADTLSGVIGQIFDKALMEPTFVEMYANFCSRLAVELPGFGEDNEKITFKRLLLNKCQEEFERGEREEEEANRTEEEGEIKQSEEEREEKRVKARRRMLGNIRLIGELYKKRMLTERIMHECIKKLLGPNQNTNPDEENIEALCKLMSTIGEMIDHPRAKEHMDVYFDMMFNLSNNMNLSSRLRFMLKDAIDLRKNKWQQRRKVEGPKKIEEVHRDAQQERQAQSSRLARGNSNLSLRRGGQPMDFASKGSASILPSNPQMGGGFRGLPQQQARGFGNQDSRFDSFENKTLSVPLRPMGDDSIKLGPQGGLASRMSVRGQPSSMQGIAGPNNGYGGSMLPERGGHGPRDDLASRYTPERFSPRPGYDVPNIQEHNNYVNRRGFDGVPPSSPPERPRVSTPPGPSQSGSSDKVVLSEDRLHDMSIEAIKEYYSARDEKEVALCIKDLNSPGFYPSMISIWVTDSFERKDMERDSLAKLLINLTKSQEGILTQDSLVTGFESVLSTLEDAVNDAPKAAEFLGRMFARILIENAIPYKEVWRMIYEGGEEQGRLVETGLASDVLGVILEIIKSEKGDPFLNDVRTSSNLQLENFRSPTLKKTSRLDKFI